MTPRARHLVSMVLIFLAATSANAGEISAPSAPRAVPDRIPIEGSDRLPPAARLETAPGHSRLSARRADPASALPFEDLDAAALATRPNAGKSVTPTVDLSDPFFMRHTTTSEGMGGPRAALAPAALPWTADQLLANPTDMNDEHVSLARSPLTGDLFAVFAATDLGGTDRDIHVSRSQDDGQTWTTWEAPSSSVDDFQPELAIDGGGYLHIVWVTGDGVVMRTRSAQADDPSTWAWTYGLPTGEVVATPSIAVSGAGDFATVFIACSWLTANTSTYQYEWTLLWMYSTNGGQSITYDYFLPDGYPDYWPDVTMDAGTVTFVNAEADYWTGEMEILVAVDTYAGTFNDVASFTGWTPNNCGFPRVAGQGDEVFVVYQHDWTDGISTDGDIVYTYSWDGGSSWYGPFEIVADEYESVGPAVFTADGVVGALWLDAPAGGDEFYLASRLAGGSGHTSFFQGIETVSDQPRVEPSFHSAAGLRADGTVHTAWIDRRDYATHGHNVYTSRRNLEPDLTPFTPAGWDSCLIAAPVRGERTDTWVAAGDTTFVSFAFSNVGLADATADFRVYLERDAVLVASWTVAGLPTASYVTIEDHPLVVGAGPHTLTVRLDPLGAVAEGDESDNVVSRTFHWLDGDPELRIAPGHVVVVMTPDPGKASADALVADPPVRRVVHVEPVAPRLAAALDKAAGGALLPVIIQPAEVLDAGRLGSLLAGAAPDQRRRTALDAARGQLARTRDDLADDLARFQGAGLAGADRPLWLAGVLKVDLAPAAVRQLAGHPAVGSLWLDDTPSRTFGARTTAVAAPMSVTAPMADAWHLPMIGADQARAQGLSGAGVLVGHLDSGVAYDHPDLTNHMWDGGVSWPNHGWDFIDNDNDPYDGDVDWHHGTHTAGLVVGDGTGGTTTGAAPGASLMALRVVPGYLEDLAEGLQFGLDHGVDLFTLSGGWTNPVEGIRVANRHQAELLLAAGVPWIISAGNGDNYGGHFAVPHNITSPADSPGPYHAPNGGATAAISVGALTNTGAVWSSSSYGPTVWDSDNPHGATNYHDYPWPPGLVKPDLAAPGDLVTSTAGGGGYVAYSGTSMACPLVAGAAALLLEAEPDLTPLQLAQALDTTASDVTSSPASVGRDNYTGAGLIDIPAALGALPHAATATFTLHNDGALPLVVGSPTDPVDWLAASAAATTVEPGTSTIVTVVLTPEGLPVGAYETAITIASNDPASPHQVPVFLDWGAGVSGIGDDLPAAKNVRLENYPNPFNPRTVLRYEVRRGGRIVLDIHDLRGRRVRRLVDAHLAAGPATVTWDGRDDRGRAVGSGQYFARLVEGGASPVTGKLMLLR